MPLLFHDISKCKPTLDETYMFDANIWVYIFESNSKSDSEYKVYHRFFEELILLVNKFQAEKAKAELKKKIPGVYDESSLPKIVLTPLLMSEIFRVLIKGRWKQWRKNHFTPTLIKPNPDFKIDFRGSQHYIDAIKELRSELFQYEQYFTIVDDSDEIIGLKHLCDNWNYDMDFHDQCYYYTCLEKKYILVTNDKDFIVSDVDIYTALPSLLIHSDLK